MFRFRLSCEIVSTVDFSALGILSNTVCFWDTDPFFA